MQKKNRTLFIILLAIVVLVLSILYFRDIDEKNSISTPLIVMKLKSKVHNYKPLMDSTNFEIFKNSIESTYDALLKVKREIRAIGERTKTTETGLDIELFVLSEINKNYFITFIKNKNGIIEINEQSIKYIIPQLSKSCNSHYFYLPSSTFNIADYNCYSLFEINNGIINDMKVMFSMKFDSFINVKCNCDLIEIGQSLEYLQKQFKLFDKRS